MIRRAKRAFRPGAERVEERCVATAHMMAAGLEVHALAAHHHAAHAPIVAARLPRHPGPSAPGHATGPGGGAGLIRLGLPSNFLDYGVVTLWNNTRTTASFNISASTFHNGQMYPFTLQPGQHQSYFAPVVNGQRPLFQVSFNANPGNIPLAQENIVFEASGYVPQGTAGWPYAIGFGVNGYFLTQI